MNDFKIGDKVRVKKISKKEFYDKKYYKFWNYNSFLKYKSRVYLIDKIYNNLIYCNINKINYCFFDYEIEKINYLKTKFKIVKELLKNEN